MTPRLRTLFIGLTAFLAACASGRGQRPEREGSRDQYLIVASELETAKQLYLYEAIRQLRPFWLSRTVDNKGGDDAIYVYYDEQRIGTMSALRRIPVSNADRVRFLSVTEAQVRYGPTNGGRLAIAVDSSKQ